MGKGCGCGASKGASASVIPPRPLHQASKSPTVLTGALLIEAARRQPLLGQLGYLVGVAVAQARSCELLQQDCIKFAGVVEKVELAMVRAESLVGRDAAVDGLRMALLEGISHLQHFVKRSNMSQVLLGASRRGKFEEVARDLHTHLAAMGLPEAADIASILSIRFNQSDELCTHVEQLGGTEGVCADPELLRQVEGRMDGERLSASGLALHRIDSLSKYEDRMLLKTEYLLRRERTPDNLAEVAAMEEARLVRTEPTDVLRLQNKTLTLQVAQMRAVLESQALELSEYTRRFPVPYNEPARLKVVKRLGLMHLPAGPPGLCQVVEAALSSLNASAAWASVIDLHHERVVACAFHPRVFRAAGCVDEGAGGHPAWVQGAANDLIRPRKTSSGQYALCQPGSLHHIMRLDLGQEEGRALAEPDVLPVAGSLRWLDPSIDNFCREAMESHDAPRWMDILRIVKEGMASGELGPQQLVAVPLVLQGQRVGTLGMVVCGGGDLAAGHESDVRALARLAERQLLKASHAAQVMRACDERQHETRPREPDGEHPDLDEAGRRLLAEHRIPPGARLLHLGRRIPLLGPLALLVHAASSLCRSAGALRRDLLSFGEVVGHVDRVVAMGQRDHIPRRPEGVAALRAALEDAVPLVECFQDRGDLRAVERGLAGPASFQRITRRISLGLDALGVGSSATGGRPFAAGPAVYPQSSELARRTRGLRALATGGGAGASSSPAAAVGRGRGGGAGGVWEGEQALPHRMDDAQLEEFRRLLDAVDPPEPPGAAGGGRGGGDGAEDEAGAGGREEEDAALLAVQSELLELHTSQMLAHLRAQPEQGPKGFMLRFPMSAMEPCRLLVMRKRGLPELASTAAGGARLQQVLQPILERCLEALGACFASVDLLELHHVAQAALVVDGALLGGAEGPVGPPLDCPPARWARKASVSQHAVPVEGTTLQLRLSVADERARMLPNLSDVAAALGPCDPGLAGSLLSGPASWRGANVGRLEADAAVETAAEANSAGGGVAPKRTGREEQALKVVEALSMVGDVCSLAPLVVDGEMVGALAVWRGSDAGDAQRSRRSAGTLNAMERQQLVSLAGKAASAIADLTTPGAAQSVGSS